MSKHLGPFPGPVNDLHSEIAEEQGQDRTPREQGRDLPALRSESAASAHQGAAKVEVLSGKLEQRMRVPAELERLSSPVLRGMELSRPESISALCDFIAENDPLAIPILSKCITHKSGYEHILALGATGSGKTTCINQVMQDALWHVGRGYGHRVFIYDYKRTARRYLAKLPL